jgi:hypothetical protein
VGVSLRTVENDIQAMRYDEGLGYFAPIEYDPVNRVIFTINPDTRLIIYQWKLMM